MTALSKDSMRVAQCLLSLAIIILSFLSFFLSVQHVHQQLLSQESTFSPSMSLSVRKRERTSEKHATISDALCPGCRLSFRRGQTQCGRRIQSLINQNPNLTLAEAGAMVASQADYCSLCDPRSCSDSRKQYWRFDSVAPKPLLSYTYFLQSIGSEARYPTGVSNNTLLETDEQNVDREYLFEFNPSIVQLPKSQVPSYAKDAVYLASFRVGNDHKCIFDSQQLSRPTEKDQHKWPYKNYLGLALLRSDLSVIMDTVVEAKKYMHAFTDPRLHVVNDQLYVASYHRIHPIWLVPPEALPSYSINPNGRQSRLSFTVTLPAIWSSSFNVTMRRYGSCTKDLFLQKTGKNLQYFTDCENRTMMEVFPMGPKEEVDLNAICKRASQRLPADWFVHSNDTLPPQSFGTVEELHLVKHRIFEYPFSGEHGSACCVPILDSEGRSLLLGLSHVRTRHRGGFRRFGFDRLTYFSSFYAMETMAPYHVVARTGRFCFGFPHPHERGGNPFVQMSLDDQMVMEGTFECPSIHFVGGMIEKADDPTKLIVAYGVNDCVPRISVVDKAHVLRMLFAPKELIRHQ